MVATFCCHCDQAPVGRNHSKTIQVRISQVRIQELAQPIRVSGKLASKAEFKLSFKIGGIVRTIGVDEGQPVKRGQVLARLDLQEIEAQVNQSRSLYEKAERDLARVKQLYEDKAVTLENYQDTQTGLDIARANLNIAEYNLRHATITAPSNGKIMRRFVETNEMVGSGQPVFLFGSSDQDWIIRLSVTDRDIIRIVLDDPVLVEFDAYPNQVFPASISEIGESDDPRTGLFEVEARLASTEQKLVSGFIGRARIIPERKERYLVIPIEALVDCRGKAGFVFSYDQSLGRAKKKALVISHIFENRVAVVSGLEPGMFVITDGSQYVIDGSQVSLFEPAPPDNALSTPTQAELSETTGP